ncbi:D-alanine--D-alanine ligase family protein [Paenibacillus mesotrionivorans]|uniref:D-alanine--D-alanine ligase family protein n=1 Tax=Paenibacillus mesotrionivorans TaxID=3160968 RepID=A0ACC7P5G1_9BACL
MKTRVGVLFGGMSVEHEVSVISGLQALHALDTGAYEGVPIYITKQGEWYTGPELSSVEEFKDVAALKKKAKRVVLFTDENGRHLLLDPKPGLFKTKNIVDEIHVAFPVTHGTYGEDGALQGFLEMNKIPYVGCDVLSSAIGMDKIAAKTILKGAGLPQTGYLWFYSKAWADNREECLARVETELGYPVIVKPANLGSSVGVERAMNADELEQAVDLVVNFSHKVLIEKMVDNLKEVNCSVLGDYEEALPSIIEEVGKTSEILSYADKYMNQASKGMSGSARIIPANITEETRVKVQDLAVKTFLELGAGGVSRIDFLIDTATDEIYINEINTIPGSLSFYLWEPSGKTFTELTSRLIQLALKRARERENLTFSIDTNLLSMHSKGGKLGTKG